MQRILLVAVGGALGAVLRVLVVDAFAERFGRGLPYGTLLVNVVGATLVGALAAWLLAPGARVDPRLVGLLVPGLLGGFTTFSAFSLEVVGLAQQGRPGAALAYATGSVLLGLAGVLAGGAAARALGA